MGTDNQAEDRSTIDSRRLTRFAEITLALTAVVQLATMATLFANTVRVVSGG